jgi:hypothetical protein
MDLKAIRIIEGMKSSHDWMGSAEKSKLWSYMDLWKRKIPSVGIPAKANGLVIIDVDAASDGGHKKDGREWWTNFARQAGVPPTYTVKTPSGGYHLYFKLPVSLNPAAFEPPKQLAPGVDIVWNGWVAAPPTQNYIPIPGMTIGDIVTLPPTVFAEMQRVKDQQLVREFDSTGTVNQHFHARFTPDQLRALEVDLLWAQTNAAPSYSEWRDGIFSLRAGIDDDEILEKYVTMWSMNQAYIPGDEEKAMRIALAADPHGPIGPGSIFGIIREMKMRQSAPTTVTPLTINEIFAKANVELDFDKKGNPVVTCNETNAFLLLKAIIPPDDLYLDGRTFLAMHKNRSIDDEEMLNMFLPIFQSTAQGLGLKTFKPAVIRRGIDMLLQDRRLDPHRDMVERTIWDGVPRVAKFWTTYCHVEDSAYVQRVATNFWVSMAARALTPGCKFDNMVIIEGWEGLKKSTLIRAIAGDYVFEVGNRKAFQDIDDLRKMHQSVITELPELIGLQGEEGNVVKNFLARPVDVIRDLFAKRPTQRRRGFVCVGSTNLDKYLDGSMGERRFWPIRIPKTQTGIDIEGITRDRQQLFAEARELFKAGCAFWEMPADLLHPVVSLRVIHDPLVTIARECLHAAACVRVIDVYQVAKQHSLIGNTLDYKVNNRIIRALQAAGGVPFNLEGQEYFEIPKISLESFV